MNSVFHVVLPSVLPSILAPVSTVVDPLFLAVVPAFLPSVVPTLGAFFAMLAFVGTGHHDGWEQHRPGREDEHLSHGSRPLTAAGGSLAFR
jgi:hypothetical protein